MKKYKVKIRFVSWDTFELEADDAAQAVRLSLSGGEIAESSNAECSEIFVEEIES